MKAATTQLKARGPFHGVSQVVRFNWPRYVMAAVVIIGGLGALQSFRMSEPLKFFAYVAVIATAWWSIASLLASYWVYDLSPLMRWEWITRELPKPPIRWLNIHAGLDESTPQLREFWPNALGYTVDIFAPGEMTEASIARARTQAKPLSTRAQYDRLPFAPGEFDGVFILFAAHELRHPLARRAFFNEVRRVLAPNGQVVLVEHLRDAFNFAVYSSGFLHFHSLKTWHADLNAAALKIEREFSFTPFVRVFILKK